MQDRINDIIFPPRAKIIAAPPPPLPGVAVVYVAESQSVAPSLLFAIQHPALTTGFVGLLVAAIIVASILTFGAGAAIAAGVGVVAGLFMGAARFFCIKSTDKKPASPKLEKGTTPPDLEQDRYKNTLQHRVYVQESLESPSAVLVKQYDAPVSASRTAAAPSASSGSASAVSVADVGAGTGISLAPGASR